MIDRKRIERLERARCGSQLFTVPIYESESDDDAIQAAGIEPTPSDTVILVTRFSGSRQPVIDG